MNTFCADSVNIWRFIGEIIYIIRIIVPVLIVLLGTIDLGKAVMSGEEKTVKEAHQLATKIEDRIQKELDMTATIHVEPLD